MKKFSNRSFCGHHSSEGKPQIKIRYKQASISRSLIAASLKNTKASSAIYHPLTTVKMVDYCFAGWSCCMAHSGSHGLCEF